MTAVGCQWSHDGSILAVAGTMSVAGAAEKDSNVIQVCILKSLSVVKIAQFLFCSFTPRLVSICVL